MAKIKDDNVLAELREIKAILECFAKHLKIVTPSVSAKFAEDAAARKASGVKPAKRKGYRVMGRSS